MIKRSLNTTKAAYKVSITLLRIVLFIPISLFFINATAQSSNFTLSKASQNGGFSEAHFKIDSIITIGIKERAFPGAQVLVLKNDTLVYHQTFGFHTYDRLIPVRPSDVYDLASVTKILGPLPALMKLADEGVLDLDAAFSTYWKPWKRIKDKRALTLREILAHQAGLQPYIVFLRYALKKDHLNRRFIRSRPSKRFGRRAYEQLFVKNSFKNKMFREIKRSKVSSEKKYRYSGLAFLVFPDLISQLAGTPYETYLENAFYKPMGCQTLGFLPKLKAYDNPIVPTEIDSNYRKTLTHGWVHDENASLLGGISGNAGLFGSAEDVARMMLMYQNMGVFGGSRYLSEDIVKQFTSVQYPENDNRRGLGFDKPLVQNATLPFAEAYPAPDASPESFGHSGFTGTFVWADPEHKLTFIFLSNRVYPSRSHRKLYELNIRTALHQVFYQSLLNRE